MARIALLDVIHVVVYLLRDLGGQRRHVALLCVRHLRCTQPHAQHTPDSCISLTNSCATPSAVSLSRLKSNFTAMPEDYAQFTGASAGGYVTWYAWHAQ
jgi:hypothetical protein